MMVELLYGAGLRLLECCRLRVKDVDFERHQLMIREAKGDKDRAVPLPDRCSSLVPPPGFGGLIAAAWPGRRGRAGANIGLALFG